MTQAILNIGRAVMDVEAKSMKASRRVRIAIGFGIVAAGYAAIVVAGLQGLRFVGLI